jgi:hypothetical protein
MILVLNIVLKVYLLLTSIENRNSFAQTAAHVLKSVVEAKER